MRIIFSLIISVLFFIPLFSQNEFQSSMIEKCLSLHLEHFVLSDKNTADTVFVCSDSRYTIKYWTDNPPFSIKKRPVVMQTLKEIRKRVKDSHLYPVYYITLKKINKSENILYIATMAVKLRKNILCFGNTEENSNYLITNNRIKRITFNGETVYSADIAY